MWIELHDGARDHPKVLKLARDLGIEEAHALGHMTALWLWALRMAPDGDLSSFAVDDIEIGAKWNGEPGAFLSAAVKRRLLDPTGTGNDYVCHDWHDYAGSLKAAKRMRDLRERKRNAEQLQDSDATVTNGNVMLRRPNDQTDRTDQKERGEVSDVKHDSKGPAGSSPPSPPPDPRHSEILRIWCETGHQVSGEPVAVDAEANKASAERILKLCQEIDSSKPLDVASERMQRYWRRKWGKGNGKAPALRFFVEDFSEHPAPAPAGSRAMTPDDLETELVRARAQKEHERSQAEAAKIFGEPAKEKAALERMAVHQKYIDQLKGRQ